MAGDDSSSHSKVEPRSVNMSGKGRKEVGLSVLSLKSSYGKSIFMYHPLPGWFRAPYLEIKIDLT